MKRLNKNNANFTFKVYENGKMVSRCQTHKLGRFLHRLQATQFKEGITKASIRVYYGRFLDTFGKMSNFYNEGIYDNKKDFTQAYKAFIEEARKL